MPSVPELRPEEVGTPIPISSSVPPESYTYDYVIVGGGTAGCVVASRLSEDPDVSVLLIEQGPVADTWASRVPLLSVNVHGKDDLTARWWSQPLAHADNRFLQVVRGEGLGGTSRINGMLYTRGTPGDYNRWKELGCEGWGYDDVEPYFAKSEMTRTHPESRYRGKNGPWQNQQFEDAPYKLTPFMDRALLNAGIPRVADVNAPSAPAACTAVMDIAQDAHFRRHSTFRAFLPPEVCAARRARLRICTGALVTRIEVGRGRGEKRGAGARGGDGDGEKREGGLRATGVLFETADPLYAVRTYCAKARREVIVCAGALGSPHILMLSGIGPKQHLEEKGVPVILDNPAVGSNLSDHMGVPIAFKVPLSDSLHELQARPLKAAVELLKYLLTGHGAFSRPFQNISTFLPTRLLSPSTPTSPSSPPRLPPASALPPGALDPTRPSNRPDIEFMHLANGAADVAPPPRTGVYTLLATLVRPRATGAVRLATANPRARPDVALGFLDAEEDRVALRCAVRFALGLGEDVCRAGYPLEDFCVPRRSARADGGDGGDEEEEGLSDEDVDAFVRANVRTCFHYTSTCRMGPDGDGAGAVVDTALRVRGVRGLRVADASVFPEIVGAHTMAPVVMVAERCADFVKAAWS